MKIIIAGDYCPHGRVADLIEKGNTDSIFEPLGTLIKDADYSIVNFECAVADKSDRKIEKCGEALRCSDKAIKVIKDAGFKCLTLANNHFYDYSDVGVEKSLRSIRENELDFVGGGKNLEDASQTLYKEINGSIIAIINCCEHEFSIATDSSGGSNPLNPIKQYYSIIEARSKADYVIVIVHGGNEHYQLPSPRMKETYRFFVDAGADVVVNHHQHCYSGYEVYHGKPIFYGLGNFCFDWGVSKNYKWHQGFLVELLFEKKTSSFHNIIPYVQSYQEPKVQLLLKQEDLDAFYKSINELNNIIQNDKALYDAFSNNVKSNMNAYIEIVEPYPGRYLRSLYIRGGLPSLLGKKDLRLAYNYILCESHMDMLSLALRKQIS